MIEVLVADDHTIFRQGLKRLLAEAPDIQVGGETGNGAEVLDMVKRYPWKVVLLDINMPGKNGLEVLRQIKAERPQLPVLVLSMYPEEQYAVEAFRAGASAYLTKGAEAEELILAIRKLAAGGKHTTAALAEHLLLDQLHGASNTPPHQKLSSREYQIFDLLVAGKSLKEIGDQLHLSISTVSTYRGRVLEKMRMETNADLVSYLGQQTSTTPLCCY